LRLDRSGRGFGLDLVRRGVSRYQTRRLGSQPERQFQNRPSFKRRHQARVELSAEPFDDHHRDVDHREVRIHLHA